MSIRRGGFRQSARYGLSAPLWSTSPRVRRSAARARAGRRTSIPLARSGAREARSNRLRRLMEDKKLGPRARYDRIGATVRITEFNEYGRTVERFHDGPDLPARQTLGRQVRKQGDSIEHGRLFALYGCHHSTQQVTNRGKSSPVRMIQIVLTTALKSCRAIGTSTRHRTPKASVASRRASWSRAPLNSACLSQAESARFRPRASRNTRALCLPCRCTGLRQ